MDVMDLTCWWLASVSATNVGAMYLAQQDAFLPGPAAQTAFTPGVSAGDGKQIGFVAQDAN